jgi:hypothetical protein
VNGDRFDDLTRLLARHTTRRQTRRWYGTSRLGERAMTDEEILRCDGSTS